MQCKNRSTNVKCSQMTNEVKDIMGRQPAGAIIHLVKTDFGTSKPKLRQATKIAKHRPILLLVRTNEVVMARCTLPEVREVVPSFNILCVEGCIVPRRIAT